MKTIAIGFSKPKNMLFPVISWGIRLYMRTPYSHAYMKFHSDSLDRDIVYESVGHGVRFVGSKFWNKHAESVCEYQVQITDESYKRLMQFCIDNAGKEYSVWQNVGVVAADILNLKTNPFSTGIEETNCAEEVCRALETVGYKFDKPLDLITPRDLCEILAANSGNHSV